MNKFTKKLKKAMRTPALISYKQMKKNWAKERKWDKKHPILAYLRNLKYVPYRVNSVRRDSILYIKSFIQRGKRGWSNRDVWSLDYYLANTIHKTVLHLKKHNNCFPANLTEGKWVDILNTISDTFYYAKRISEGRLCLIRSERKRKKTQKSLAKINKEHKGYNRCMTDKEIERYDLGWELLKKYFSSLWD